MFFALLRKAIREYFPSGPGVLVVFDGEMGSTGRTAIDPGYKAHRPGGEAALAPIRALPDVKRGLDALKISWTEIEDAEADDVIATLVSRVPDGRDVLIMSRDRDMYQLVTDRVLVLNTAMRPGHRLIGPKHIEARYGVLPSAWCCRAGLAGDPSDGIKLLQRCLTEATMPVGVCAAGALVLLFGLQLQRIRHLTAGQVTEKDGNAYLTAAAARSLSHPASGRSSASWPHSHRPAS